MAVNARKMCLWAFVTCRYCDAPSTPQRSKDANDVGLSVVIPERDEQAQKVQLPKDVIDELKLMQEAYAQAREVVKNDGLSGNEAIMNPNSAYNQIKQRFGESDELMAHPFNLIRKMDVLIADSEFGKGATFYDFDAGQTKIAQEVIDKFNKKNTKTTALA